MLIDIEQHITKPVMGIIQVGAHHGNEYDKLKNISKNILMFEPQKNVYDILVKNVAKEKGVILENCALGSEETSMMMFKEHANQGQSSSLMMPSLHMLQYPGIKFTETEKVNVTTLDRYFENHNFCYSLITLDVQGYELKVLQGATTILNKIDYILCEVNRAELYQGCPMIEEIDNFLSNYGFCREVTSWDGYTWGDAFYLKK